MKFGGNVLQKIHWYTSTDGVGFLTWRHTFKMAAMMSLQQRGSGPAGPVLGGLVGCIAKLINSQKQSGLFEYYIILTCCNVSSCNEIHWFMWYMLWSFCTSVHVTHELSNDKHLTMCFIVGILLVSSILENQPNISQGSVVTCFWRAGIFNDCFIAKLLISVAVRILRIAHYLA